MEQTETGAEQTSDPRIKVLSGGAVMVDYGPMRMVIQAYDRGRPVLDLAKAGADQALRVLDDLARFVLVIRKKAWDLEIEAYFPEVVRRMIAATKEMGARDLTPLAAVAGSASDVVADHVIGLGGTKIIVDNGGDVAIRLREGEGVKIGVKTAIEADSPAYLLTFDSSRGIGGVATSGLGGRSFTKGIASAAAIVAKTASIADAAATVIGNETNVEDPAIVRCPAETIYPDTDIAGEWVTTRVGPLEKEKIGIALERGLEKASSLCRRGLIEGALIAVQGETVWTESLSALIRKIGQ